MLSLSRGIRVSPPYLVSTVGSHAQRIHISANKWTFPERSSTRQQRRPCSWSYQKVMNKGDASGVCCALVFGTRDATAEIEMYDGGVPQKAVFLQGAVSSCLFQHSGKRMEALVHGDLTIAGHDAALVWIESALAKTMMLKRKGPCWGPDVKDSKTVALLSRLITYRGKDETAALLWEPDLRHVNTFVGELHLQVCNTKGLLTPGSKDTAFIDERRVEGAAARVRETMLCCDWSVAKGFGCHICQRSGADNDKYTTKGLKCKKKKRWNRTRR